MGRSLPLKVPLWKLLLGLLVWPAIGASVFLLYWVVGWVLSIPFLATAP